jgi:hypothetical protein
VKVPSARHLFKTYLAILVGIAVVAVVVDAASRWASDASLQPWRDAPAIGFATAIALRGPEPPVAAESGVAPGESFYYGPLAAGECLPPIDVVDFVPAFGFNGAGAVYNYGRTRGDAFEVVASFVTLPERLPAEGRYLQVCFPSGIDHEQALRLAARRGGAAASPFPGQPGIPPPPLQRVPADVSVHAARSPAGYALVGDRTIFRALGRRCEVRVEKEVPIVVELGEIEDGSRFVVRDTLRVDAGGTRLDGLRVRWPYFRIVLPTDAGRAHVSFAQVPEA